MSSYQIGNYAAQLSQAVTGESLIVNYGPDTVYLDTATSVSPLAASLKLFANQSMTWKGGVLYAVCAAGESAEVTQLFDAGSTTLPFTTISGPVDATITGPVAVTGPVTVNGAVTQEVPYELFLDASINSSSTVTAVFATDAAQTVRILLTAANATLHAASDKVAVEWYSDAAATVLVTTDRAEYLGRSTVTSSTEWVIPVKAPYFRAVFTTSGGATGCACKITGGPAEAPSYTQKYEGNTWFGLTYAAAGITGSGTYTQVLSSAAGEAVLSIWLGAFGSGSLILYLETQAGPIPLYRADYATSATARAFTVPLQLPKSPVRLRLVYTTIAGTSVDVTLLCKIN